MSSLKRTNKQLPKASTREIMCDLPDTPPKDFQSAAWNLLRSIKGDTAIICERLDHLENRVSHLEISLEEKDIKVSELTSEVDILNQKLKIAEARANKAQAQNKQINKEIDNMKSHSMKENLIFSFDDSYEEGKEVIGENCVSIIKAFLSNVLAIDEPDMFIPTAHRLGKRFGTKTRPIIARFPVVSQLHQVLHNSNRLRDTKHYITRQLTPTESERKQFIIPKFLELKKDPKNKAKLSAIEVKLVAAHLAHAVTGGPYGT